MGKKSRGRSNQGGGKEKGDARRPYHQGGQDCHGKRRKKASGGSKGRKGSRHRKGGKRK